MEVIKKKELCIVHVGMPKTGSSTLQNAFFKGLNDKSVSYGNLPNSNQSGWLYGLFAKDIVNYHFFKGWGIDTQDKIDKFREESKKLLITGFENSGTSIEILSGEDLFHLHEEGVRELKNFLTAYFKNIVIVAYVRPVKSFLESAFQQMIKHVPINRLDSNLIYHRYTNFASYLNVFGTDSVQLWRFDPKQFPEGDILLDFTTRLGLQPQRSKIKVVNESIAKEAISILFTYHFHENAKTDFGERQYKLRYQLVELLRKIGSEKFKFSGQFIQRAIAANQEDYEWIVRVMGEDFKETPESLSAEGVDNEHELMHYATQFIPNLVELAGEFAKDLKLDDTPQTVARLVDKIMLRLAHDHR